MQIGKSFLMSLAEKTQFRSKGLHKETNSNEHFKQGNEKKPKDRADFESEDYYEEGSSLGEAEISIENPTTLHTPNSLDATKLGHAGPNASISRSLGWLKAQRTKGTSTIGLCRKLAKGLLPAGPIQACEIRGIQHLSGCHWS